ncbi:MAG: DUF4956 domain-containing protein [Anaerolineales bacterium]|nr:DUF4956 domain-containing protein [Anaerolineales bacterium]
MNMFSNLLLGFSINFIAAWIIVRLIYYRSRPSKNYIFSFLAFNTVVFFVVSYLTNLEISIGVGFGLFAFFSLLRYRTDPMPAREMTYLFVIIALPVMNSVLSSSSLWMQAVIVNAIVVVILFALEEGWGFRFESSKRIRYDKIELIKPEFYPLLMNDLQTRTGLPITRVEIKDINFLRDTADIKVYYNGEDWEALQQRSSDHEAGSDKLY